ncbi:hypothetical protein Pme01_31960 [Planosporangium mesophilum]|uniref:Uncharacterized protein n=1 Tax=Planosporangium mesophilum TaxID=689768 RepID=A0A8J3X1Q4_9ACTN|nr:hypothetical protein Pme01_31960 [Planosporangium mesophilum]
MITKKPSTAAARVELEREPSDAPELMRWRRMTEGMVIGSWLLRMLWSTPMGVAVTGGLW